MSIEAYKIAVTMSLTNHVSAGLAGMVKDFAKTDAQATLLQKRLKGIQSDFIKGGLMFGAGVGMLGMLKAPYEEAKKLAQAQANFQTLNLSAVENGEAFAKASTMSHKILGTTITENVKLIHDLHTAFGSLHHALGTADSFAKMSIVAKVANGGKDSDGIVMAAAKALEHRGGKVVNNPEVFANELDLMTKVMLATKMRVSPKDYMGASSTGKMAYQMMDKEYLYGNFAGLMSINGGVKTGTAAMTAFSSLVGGHMDSKGKGFMASLGLWTEGFSKNRLKIMNQALDGLSPAERKTAIAGMGGQSTIAGGLSDANAELFAHRPDLFVARIVPLIRKRYGMDMTDEQVGLLIAKNFNRNTGDYLGTQVTMATKLAKDTGIINKTMGFRSGYSHYMKTPEGAEEAAGAAWKNFLAMFGSVYLPQITKGLTMLAGSLDSMSGFVSRNHTLVKGLVLAFESLAIGLAVKGGVRLFAAALDGLGLVLGFTKIGGILGINRTAVAIEGVGTKMALMSKGLGLMSKAFAVVAWVELGLQIAKILGLPDTNKKKGMEDVKRGDWLAASADLPAMDFFRAVGHRFKHLGVTAKGMNTDDKPGGYYDRLKNGNLASTSIPNAPKFNTPNSLIQIAPIVSIAPSSIATTPKSSIDTANGSKTTPINTIRPASQNKSEPIVADVNLDGYKVGKIVFASGYQSASSPFSGISGFDMGQSLISPGMAAR